MRRTVVRVVKGSINLRIRCLSSEGKPTFPWMTENQPWKLDKPILSRFFINMMLMRSPFSTGIIDEKEMMEGGREAFTQTVKSIFAKLSGDSAKQEETLPLSSLCDGSLVEFVETASTKLGKNKLHYELLHVGVPKILWKDVTLGATRSLDPTKAYKMRLLGTDLLMIFDEDAMKMIMELVNTGATLYQAFLKGPETVRSLTVQVALAIPCKEIFYEKSEQDVLLQGSTEPRDVTHQIVLENVFRLNPAANKSTSLTVTMRDWDVVDINNWLQGNKYWLKVERSISDYKMVE